MVPAMGAKGMVERSRNNYIPAGIEDILPYLGPILWGNLPSTCVNFHTPFIWFWVRFFQVQFRKACSTKANVDQLNCSTRCDVDPVWVPHTVFIHFNPLWLTQWLRALALGSENKNKKGKEVGPFQSERKIAPMLPFLDWSGHFLPNGIWSTGHWPIDCTCSTSCMRSNHFFPEWKTNTTNCRQLELTNSRTCWLEHQAYHTQGEAHLNKSTPSPC